jgi:hypothetical protein
MLNRGAPRGVVKPAVANSALISRKAEQRSLNSRGVPTASGRVTSQDNVRGSTPARDVALAIRAKIKEVTGLNASAGISYNKLLAKLASDHRKPNGQYVITPEMGPAFVEAPTESGRLRAACKNSRQLRNMSGTGHIGSPKNSGVSYRAGYVSSGCAAWDREKTSDVCLRYDRLAEPR